MLTMFAMGSPPAEGAGSGAAFMQFLPIILIFVVFWFMIIRPQRKQQDQRRRMREVIDLFREHGTLDELGIGSVRDTFGELLFPGLSTVQTRARYFLFIPWVYHRIERERPAARETR